MIYEGKSAILSEENTYRYSLTRTWDINKPICCFIGLNPSTADANEDDPTIRRCVNFANQWGYGELIMINLFAFRATNPNEMKAVIGSAIGPKNNNFIKCATDDADLIIAAWGNHGSYLCRDSQVRMLISKPIYHLGLTTKNQPKHPLYLKSTTVPTLWSKQS